MHPVGSEVTAGHAPLAVFTPLLGRQGQTFVKHHIDKILPGRTVVVAVYAFEPTGPCWTADHAPVLFVPPRVPPSAFRENPEKTMFETIPSEHVQRFTSSEHMRRIEAFLRKHNVEVILAQWLVRSLPLVDMAKELGIRYFCQTHGTDITSGILNSDIRNAYAGYNRVDGVVAPSEFGRQQLLGLGLRPDLVHVIRHGVPVPSLPSERSEAPLRCLAAGRLTAMKGPLTIIDAFHRAVTSCPQLQLDYVGDATMWGTGPSETWWSIACANLACGTR